MHVGVHVINFCVKNMNLQSENENGTEKCLKHYPNFIYVRGSGSNGNHHNTGYDINKDQRDYDQNANAFKSHYNEEYIYCNRVRKKCINPPYSCNSMSSESQNTFLRASSENVNSRYTETKHLPNSIGEKESKQTQNESNFNQKYDIHAKLTLRDSFDHVSDELHDGTHKNLYSDKTTYCRPVLNLYNQEFLFKTMEKNAKLRRLVKELVIARQKEKQMENWNDYINELRNKHSRDMNVKRATSLQYISDELEATNAIENIYNTKFKHKKSKPCEKLLKYFYKPNDIEPSYYDYYRTLNDNIRSPRRHNLFKTNTQCFPTSSLGRIIILEKERIKRLENRGYKPLFQTINEEKRLETEDLKTSRCKRLGADKNYIIRNSRSTNTTLKCTSTQTEFQKIPSKSVDPIITNECNTNHVVRGKRCNKEMCNKEMSPENVCCADNDLKKSSLICIEEKLDNLIHTINSFIVEMKTKSAQHKYFDQYTKLSKRNVNYTRSDSCSMARKEKIVCGCVDNSSRTTRNSSIDNFNRIQTIDDNVTKMNEIILQGIGKNKLITLKGSSVRQTYHPCAVQISVTIPTKEISTEVTRSLSKTGNLQDRNSEIEEISRREDKSIAIAVNTDPLSLLAILRVSTEETIRRLMSYVPTIDYYSYLSRLQRPSPKAVESHYVCNICGAAFMKPSELTDHIQKHELGKTRDCCVCRHVLDLPRRRPSLFKCQYCGQRFTRAYCCELHQEACARRIGKLHDVTSSLMLLR